MKRPEPKGIGSRLAGWTLGLFVMLTISLCLYLLWPCLTDPTPGFDQRRGVLVEARETDRMDLGNTILTEVRLASSSGLVVEIAVRVPKEMDTRLLPLVVLLGGHRTGRDAARLVGDTSGVVVAALSYPYWGDPVGRGLLQLTSIPRIQQAILDTPPAVLLAIDYLLGKPYVDSERVELVGVSLGAFIVSVPGALDPRISRVWLIHGAGKPPEVLTHRLKEYIDWATARRLAGYALGFLSCSHYLQPERWVGRIAPRPVIVVNARNDQELPSSSVASLHQAVCQPAEIIWTEGQHVLPTRRETVEKIADLVLERLAREREP